MVEAFVIIGALGGLEAILWYFDHRQQKKQIELLDSIWAELAIRNSVEEEQQGSTRNVANEDAGSTDVGGRSRALLEGHDGVRDR